MIIVRVKGLINNCVLYGYVFCNAMLLIIVGFFVVFIGIFFIGFLLIEVIFFFDGLGLMSFEVVINCDYLVVFGIFFIFILLGLVVKLIGDIIYILVDPCIDFESWEG